jgi:hypothetical protein
VFPPHTQWPTSRYFACSSLFPQPAGDISPYIALVLPRCFAFQFWLLASRGLAVSLHLHSFFQMSLHWGYLQELRLGHRQTLLSRSDGQLTTRPAMSLQLDLLQSKMLRRLYVFTRSADTSVANLGVRGLDQVRSCFADTALDDRRSPWVSNNLRVSQGWY